MYLGFTVEISRPSNIDPLLGTNEDDSEEFVKILKKLVNESTSSDRQAVTFDSLDQIKKLK